MTVEQVRPGLLRLGPFTGSTEQAALRGQTYQGWYDKQEGSYLVGATRDVVTGQYAVTVRSADDASPVPHPPTELLLEE